jgi:hypothetical protein
MNIIVSLKDYLVRYFNIDNETASTIVITILIFSIGGFLNHFWKEIDKLQKRKNTRLVFKSTIKTYSKKIMKQGINYYETSLQFDIKRRGVLKYTVHNMNYQNTINNIGYENVSNAFFNGIENILKLKRKRKQELLIRVYDYLNAVDFWQSKSLEDKEKYLKEYNEFNNLRNQCAFEITELIVEAVNYDKKLYYPEIQERTNQYLDELIRIVEKWKEIKNGQQSFIMKNELIDKINVLNNKYPDLDCVNKMTKPLTYHNYYYDTINNIMMVQKLQHQNLSFSLKFYSRTLNIAANKL